MTLGEALELTDRRIPNLYSREEKLAWPSSGACSWRRVPTA